jgi:predicted acetyltransferase
MAETGDFSRTPERRIDAALPVLVPPCRELLAEYEAALAAGWSPNNTRDVSGEQLAALRRDRDAFLADLSAAEGTVTLGDGRVVPRLPFRLFWLWDGAFCGTISLRFQRGTEALPSYCSGHVGYAVVPWKRRRLYATRALGLLLPIAREEGLDRVLVTCDEDNLASRKVIEANGGILAGTEPADDAHGPDTRKLLFWIATRSDRA